MALGLDHDLEHLLQVNCAASSQLCIFVLLEIKPEHIPSPLTVDFQRIVTSDLGQLDHNGRRVSPGPRFQTRNHDHHPSECDNQLVLGVVHLPWITC